MSVIRISSSDGSGLNPGLMGGHTALVLGNVLGRGGFGEVWECQTLDGQAPSEALAVKILGEAGDAAAQEGYKTIGLLFDRVRRADQQRVLRGDLPLATVPGLIGIPLCRFTGHRNGKLVYGYVMYRLDSRGYQSLEPLIGGEDPDGRMAYLTRPLAERIEIAACLAETLHILIEELGYLHCDINEPNLWIHRDVCHCALIDYDGGMLLGENRPAATFGKMGECLAPEIMQEIALPHGDPLALVGRDSEYWSLLVCISYLLFLVHPLFFLQTMSANGVRAYLAQYRWPEIAPSDPNWNVDNAAFYAWFVEALEEAPEHYVDAFDLGLRNGYFHPDQRHSPAAWRQALLGSGDPPEIYVFSADAEAYPEGAEVRLRWWAFGAHTLLLMPDIGSVAHSGEIVFTATQGITYHLKARNMFGYVEESAPVRVVHLPKFRGMLLPSHLKIPSVTGVKISGALITPMTVKIPSVIGVNIASPMPSMAACPKMSAPQLRQSDISALGDMGATARIAALVQELRNAWEALTALHE